MKTRRELIEFFDQQNPQDRDTINKIWGDLVHLREPERVAECYRIYAGIANARNTDEEYNDVIAGNQIWEEINGNIKR